MSNTTTQLREKNKGPCQLCGATVATSWRKLPSTIPQAVGTTACNPCFVYLSKRAKDDPDMLDEALALCRAAKRPCRSRGNGGSDSEGDAPSSSLSPEGSDRSTGGFEQSPSGSGGGRSPRRPTHSTLPHQSPGQPSISSPLPVGAYVAAPLQVPVPMQPGQGWPQQWPRMPQQQAAQWELGQLDVQWQQQAQQARPQLVLQPQPQQQAQQAWPQRVQQEQQQQQQQQHGQWQAQHAQQASPQQPPAALPQQQQQQLPAQPAQPPSAQLPAAPGGSPVLHGAPLDLPVARSELKGLQSATWRMACGSEHMRQALSAALRAARQLPGSNPQLLGVLPTVWLLQPGRAPEPALALLLSTLLPPQRLPTELRGPQALLRRRAAGLEPTLRLLVCGSETGELRQWRDWLQQDERPLRMQPRFGVPAWDSGDGWQLLFPKLARDTTQASLFSGILASIGLAPPGATSREQPSALAGGSNAPETAQGPGVQASTSMQPLARNQRRRPREELQQQPLAPPPPLPRRQQQHHAGALAAPQAVQREQAAWEQAPMQSQLAALAAPRQQQQQQQQLTCAPNSPAEQAAPGSGMHASMALRPAPSLSDWAAQHPRLLTQKPPQAQVPQPTPQPRVPAPALQPAQPLAHLVPAQVQHDSAPLLFVPQLGGGFDSWLAGPLPSQQAQQAQQQQARHQTQQAQQQAQHDDDLHDLLAEDEVAMLLDDLLDPLLPPGASSDFLL